MIYYMIDERYRSSYCCSLYSKGIIKEAARRTTDITEIEYKDHENPPFEFNSDDICIVLSVRYKWIQKFVPYLLSLGMGRVVMMPAGLDEKLPMASAVSINYDTAMKSIAKILESENKKNTALFCVDASFTSDGEKIAAFVKNVRHGNPGGIIYRDDTLAEMSEIFYEQREKYDSVICVNPISYVTLTNCYAKRGENLRDSLYVAMFGDIVPEDFSMNCDIFAQILGNEAGKAAFTTAMLLQKSPELMSVSMTLTCDVKITNGDSKAVVLQTSSKSKSKTSPVETNELSDEKYLDENTIVIENVLCHCDSLDMSILYALMANEVYSKIATRLHISENTISYRLKRMLKLYPGKTREELLEELKMYL
jgi:hypothetical protein